MSAVVQTLPGDVLLLARVSGRTHAPVLSHSVLQVGAVVLVNRAVVVVVAVVGVVASGGAAAAQQCVMHSPVVPASQSNPKCARDVINVHDVPGTP